MALDAYKAKRRFSKTPEPKAEAAAAVGPEPIFVVQKHAARRLHYDLRLEINGGLASWAVPEGPSLDPKVRRFAKRTEDHPMAYAGFEGRIPEGEYGAGEVIVWDRGTYVTLEPDPAAALERGELKFRLLGEKLRGGFMLIRLKDDPTNWLLIKERDTEARPSDEIEIAKARPESVVSGRTIEARVPKSKAKPPPPKPASPPEIDALGAPGAVAAATPQSLSPQLCTAVERPPDGAGWLHEIKYDGYRTLVYLEGGAARLMTRNGLDWSARYGRLTEALRKLPVDSAVLDGEIVVQDAQGVSSLALLEQALSERRTEALTFFAFDLLYLNGADLTRAPLLARKTLLSQLLAPVAHERAAVQYSEHIEGDGEALFAQASRLGLEGVVSKRADAPYLQGRSKTWVKAKRVEIADFTIVGFTTNAPKCVAALLLAAESPDGGLVYQGRVGSGIGEARARDLFAALSAIAATSALVSPKPRVPGVTWVEPRFCAQVGFRARSSDGTLRQAALIDVTPIAAPPPPDAAPVKPRLLSDRDLAAIRLTNPEREMFEGSGTTKLDVALYYARIADWMLPDLMRRPVSLIRCPTGVEKDCFYQRHAFHGLPAGIDTIELAEEEGRGAYLTITEPRGLLGLCQFGAIEFHPWGSRIDDPERPDRLVIDLDPDPDLPFAVVRDAAFALRERLVALGLTPFLRTTGGKGLHLVVALERKHDWPLVKGFAEAFVRAAAADQPQLFLAVATKAKRKGKIYLDYLRNGRGATAIASYSLRARKAFPVAAPVTWDEARTLQGGSAFDRNTMLARVAKLRHDPWAELDSSAGVITGKMRRDVGMKT